MKTQACQPILLILLFLSSTFGQVHAAQSQPAVQLNTVQVGLFPEYYRPAVLVVLDIELAETTAEPVLLTFQVPADSDSLGVSERAEDGESLPVDYETSAFGKWRDVRLSTSSQNILIEYYDPNLAKEGDLRSYEFQWLSIYSVESLSIVVRQPFGAGEIQSEPPLAAGEAGPDSANYFYGEVGRVPAGELFTLNLMYTKDTGNLAYPALEVQPAEPVSDTTPGRTPSPFSVIMWLLTVAVAVLLLVSLYYWWFKSNVMEKQDRTVQGVGIMNPEKQAVFCHECGMRSRPADSYCSNCSTELRRPNKKTRRSFP